MLALTALGPAGPYAARNRQPVADVAGAPVAELSVVPPLYVARAMAALARAPELPAAERLAALRRAGAAFAAGTVAGLPAAEHQRLVSRVSGMPLAVVRSAADFVRRAAAHVTVALDSARPAGAVDRWQHAGPDGRAVWTRRGDVLAVLAAGNHPAVHAPWLEALALGYRVAVRPSRREPLTPYRLVTALREAGFGPDRLVLLPTEHATADRLVELADLALVYGGQDVMDRYATTSTVLGQGPGRSKILLTASGGDWRDHLDAVVGAVSDEGGTACTNTTAVYVEGDPTEVATELAARLAALPSLPPEHPDARLPVQPLDVAKRLEGHLLARARGCTVRLGGDGLVDELPDGSAVLRPAVVQVDRAGAPQTGVELAFPCVWVAPWSPADGVAPLRDTLVLGVSTRDEALVDRLVAEPTIRNVYVDDLRTLRTAPHLPHDGYLGEFLMRTKAVIRR